MPERSGVGVKILEEEVSFLALGKGTGEYYFIQVQWQIAL
jgi:hypothetical protein